MGPRTTAIVMALSMACTFVGAAAYAQTPPKTSVGQAQNSGGQQPPGQQPTTVTTVTLIQTVTQQNDRTSTAKSVVRWDLRPSGRTFNGPVRVCMGYMPNDRKDQVGSNLKMVINSMLKEIMDPMGQPSYVIPPGDPEDDKPNSRVCVTLVSTRR